MLGSGLAPLYEHPLKTRRNRPLGACSGGSLAHRRARACVVGACAARVPPEYVARLALRLGSFWFPSAKRVAIPPCRRARKSSLPSSRRRGAAGKKPAPVRRYLSTIALAHRVAKLPNPCTEEVVLLAVRALDTCGSLRASARRALWGGRRSSSSSRAPGTASRPRASGRWSASRTTAWLAEANSSRSTSRTWSSCPTALQDRPVGGGE